MKPGRNHGEIAKPVWGFNAMTQILDQADTAFFMAKMTRQNFFRCITFPQIMCQGGKSDRRLMA